MALVLLLLVAFVLRVWNLNWDEGTHQHPDERYWSIITSEISAPGIGGYFDSDGSTLNPYNLENRDTWVYGTLPLFATKAAASFLADGPFPAGAIVTTADAVGIDLRTDGVDNFDSGYNANLVGRLLSALIDTATVLMVYLLGRDLFDRRVGFVAATLLTFTVLHIQYAHFYGAEPWVAFFVTAGVWLSVRLAQGDLRARVSGGVGVVLGLGMASKLTGVAALAVPAVAILIAVAPTIAALAARAWQSQGSLVRSHKALVTSMAVSGLALLGSVALWLPELVVLVAVLAVVGVVATSMLVVRRANRDTTQAPKPVHVVIWGAFSGILVLGAAALAYRVFQPYSFDSPLGLDPRFSRDIEYLEGVNSGGNVPWVVQWVGRTPLLFPLKSVFLWGMGPALAIAVLFGIWRSATDVVRRQRWVLLLPLVLITVMLGLVSQQFNPLIRYLQPAYPTAIVLGGYAVVTLWDAGRNALTSRQLRQRLVARGLQLASVGLVVGTAFWGLAFVNGVYNTDHPRITASVWMADNLPDGAVLSNQIWDDVLPLGVPGTEAANFVQVALDPFQADRAINAETQLSKPEQFIANLDRIDYVVEASNRIYDSVSRIPAKYPSTNAYYDALFDGRLGFEQIAQFRTSPSLFGLTIPDYFAEETFTVYDHPTVTIWAKTSRFSPQLAEAILNPAKAAVAVDLVPNQASTNALLLAPDQAATLATGQTFNETFNSEGPTGRVTWLWWLLWMQLAALAVLPWTTLLFSALPDRGYGLTKIIGLVAVGLGTWLTVSWDVANYGRGLAWVWFGAVVAGGTWLWHRHAPRMAELFITHRRVWFTSELVFLGVFMLALWMRSANPDLWEAYLGGEKPMEMGYLTAIARSSEFPAPDPWFSGGFINYYYFGWYLITVPMRALRIAPDVGFNLGVASYAAMTAATTFSVVHNLVAASRERWGPSATASPRAPVRAGLLGVVLLMGIGNLDAIRLQYARLRLVNNWDVPVLSDIAGLSHVTTFAGGTWAWLNGASLERFDWWQPSRVNRGNFDITEFPYFTFLFGDLHPHMMGMVFVGLTVSLALAYLLTSRTGDRRRTLFLAAGLGLVSGLVRVVNTWDLPSVMILTVAAILLGQGLAPIGSVGNDQQRRAWAAMLAVVGVAAGLSNFGGPGSIALLGLGTIGAASLVALMVRTAVRIRILGSLGHLSLAVGVHVVVFWPFLRSSETIDTGLLGAVDGSPLDDFLVHWGIFLALAIALAAALMVDARRRSRVGDPGPGPLPAFLWEGALWKGMWIGLAASAVFATGQLATGAAAVSVGGVIIFAALLATEVRRPTPDIGRLMAVGLFTLAFAIGAGVELVTVRNDIGRMNTVFKFWLQAWQYFAFAGAFAIWQVARVAAERPREVRHAGTPATLEIKSDRRWGSDIWFAMVAILILAGLAYPLLATRTRLETRFAQLPITLNGLAYLEADPTIVRLNEDGTEVTVPIGDDLALIEWFRENVEGTPTLVEWAGAPYDWNARMAVYTGMQSVLGWDWHQKQQRWSFQSLVDQRLQAIRALYLVADPDEVTRFLAAYDVAYVVVGTQELRFATPEALAKLADHPALYPAFSSGEYVIYRVDRNALWPDVDLTTIVSGEPDQAVESFDGP